MTVGKDSNDKKSATYLLPFHLWKEMKMNDDAKENGGIKLIRDKFWYYDKYGVYCKLFYKKESTT